MIFESNLDIYILSRSVQKGVANKSLHAKLRTENVHHHEVDIFSDVKFMKYGLEIMSPQSNLTVNKQFCFADAQW